MPKIRNIPASYNQVYGVLTYNKAPRIIQNILHVICSADFIRDNIFRVEKTARLLYSFGPIASRQLQELCQYLSIPKGMEVASVSKGLSGIFNEGQMKTILFLSLFFLSVFTFSLRGADNALPRITIVSSDASFITKVYWESAEPNRRVHRTIIVSGSSGSYLLYE